MFILWVTSWWCCLWALEFLAFLTFKIRGGGGGSWGEQRGNGRWILTLKQAGGTSGWNRAICVMFLLPRKQTCKHPRRSWTGRNNRRILIFITRLKHAHIYSTHRCANGNYTSMYLVLLKCSLVTVRLLGPSVCCYFPCQIGRKNAVVELIELVDLSCISSSGYRGLVPAGTAWLVWEWPEKTN